MAVLTGRSGRPRTYDTVDLSSRAFWSTTAADRERSFAELRAERPELAVLLLSQDVETRRLGDRAEPRI